MTGTVQQAQGADNKATTLGAEGSRDTKADGQTAAAAGQTEQKTEGQTQVDGQTKDGKEGAKDDKGKDGKTDKPAARAPEKYEAWKLPDGVEIDKATAGEFEPVARKLDLTQEQAQGLVDFHAQLVAKQAKDQAGAFETMKENWLTEAKNDKEIGGDKFDENVGFARKALEKLGSPKLIEAFNTTGTGNHPEIIRLLAKIGREIGEDGMHKAGAANGAADLATTLYPSMQKKG
jgi:hypothetical protein